MHPPVHNPMHIKSYIGESFLNVEVQTETDWVFGWIKSILGFYRVAFLIMFPLTLLTTKTIFRSLLHPFCMVHIEILIGPLKAYLKSHFKGQKIVFKAK